MTVPTSIGPDSRGGRDGSFMQLMLRTEWFEPVVVLAGEDLDARSATLLDSAESLLVDWHTALRGRAWLQPAGGVSTYPDYEPPARPPRAAAIWPSAALLDIVDPRIDEEPGEPWSAEVAAEIATALRAAMPPGTRRVERDGLMVFRWIDDLHDEDAVSRALDARYRWIVEALGAAPAPGWNEAGDEEVVFLERVARPPLTLYDPRSRVGYVAIVATAGGEVDEDTLAAAAAWARAGRLPDGTPLADLRLIAPVRSAAIALRERSRVVGLPTVLYMTSDGHLWNPFPEGVDDE